MNFEKQKSLKMKYQALYWLRVVQRCMFIATEAGAYNSDVFGVSEKKIIEIEVKTSFDDFRNDFKKHKHHVYRGGYEGSSTDRWVPTHFYFLVQKDLVEKCQEFLEKSNVGFTKDRRQDYGLIQMDEFCVIRRAKWLHKREPDSRVKSTIALRMGSELLRFHEAWL